MIPYSTQQYKNLVNGSLNRVISVNVQCSFASDGLAFSKDNEASEGLGEGFTRREEGNSLMESY